MYNYNYSNMTYLLIMAFNFEYGIDDFYKRRGVDVFGNVDLEPSFRETIETLKAKIAASDEKPKVVILGGGPAGLMRAIQSISNGNPTLVIEKRAENASGRANTVALTSDTIKMLKYCGIYQYLMENKWIYPPNASGIVCVRLGDLEKAMKAVLQELNLNQQTIQYNS
jgi:hypothetical protein